MSGSKGSIIIEMLILKKLHWLVVREPFLLKRLSDEQS